MDIFAKIQNKTIILYGINFDNLEEKIHHASRKYSLSINEIFSLIEIIKKEFERSGEFCGGI